MTGSDAFLVSVAAVSKGPQREALIELMKWISGQAPEEEEAVLRAIQDFAKAHNVRLDGVPG